MSCKASIHPILASHTNEDYSYLKVYFETNAGEIT